ncbi:MAG: chaperone modulator CbpM [Syntrophomonadaceae bacterium]|jgi:MerR family transcriptional regulator/heat shock protein HspR
MKLVRIVYPQDQWLPISRLQIHPHIVDILVELGVLEVIDEQVNQTSLQRLNKIMRLKDSLGVNLNGAILIADLLDRIDELEEQVRQLKELR